MYSLVRLMNQDEDEEKTVCTLRERSDCDTILNMSLVINFIIYGFFLAQSLLFMSKPLFAVLWAAYSIAMLYDTALNIGKIKRRISLEVGAEESGLGHILFQGVYLFVAAFVSLAPLFI